MRKSIFLVRIILCTPAFAAHSKSAIEQRYSHAYDECMSQEDAKNGVTVALVNCLGQEDERQDLVLNEAYKLVMTRLTPEQKTTLRDLERTWVKNRIKVCENEFAGQDGTMVNIELANCSLDETIKRTIFLENYK